MKNSKRSRFWEYLLEWSVKTGYLLFWLLFNIPGFLLAAATMLYKGVLELDDIALRKAVASLYGHGIHSVRQQQKMVDKALRAAFDRYVFQPSSEDHSIVVGQGFLSEAMEQGDYVTVKKARF